MPCDDLKNVPHIGPLPGPRADRSASVSKRDRTVKAEIHDHFQPGVETMHVPGLVIHRISGETNAFKTNGGHWLKF